MLVASSFYSVYDLMSFCIIIYFYNLASSQFVWRFRSETGRELNIGYDRCSYDIAWYLWDTPWFTIMWLLKCLLRCIIIRKTSFSVPMYFRESNVAYFVHTEYSINAYYTPPNIFILRLASHFRYGSWNSIYMSQSHTSPGLNANAIRSHGELPLSITDSDWCTIVTTGSGSTNEVSKNFKNE